MHRVRDKIALQLALDFDLPTFKAREAAIKVLHLLAREGYLHVEEMEWQKNVAWQEELGTALKESAGHIPEEG